jgi:group I intron endonuclease
MDSILVESTLMITGIYRLCFPNTDKVYVGQAKDIYLRYKTHRTSLNTGDSPKKLQNAYYTYGMPTLDILMECNISDLNKYEDEAIQIFDAVKNGFNTLEGSTHRSELKGELAGNAKYTNNQIEEVFMYLIDNKLSFKDIEEITDVNKGTITDISCGISHKWLQEKFPVEYLKLAALKGTQRKISKNYGSIIYSKYPKIISPKGVVYQVTSLRGFCREHDLNHGSLGEVLRGHRDHHKGWKVYKI